MYVLLQYLTELEYSGVNRNKEQSGRMLGHLISKAPQLIRPYMQPILAVLIPKLKEPDQNIGVVISILTAVGDIALVCQLILYLSFVWLFCFFFLFFCLFLTDSVRWVTGRESSL